MATGQTTECAKLAMAVSRLEEFGPAAVLLFGSQARGHERPGDYDLGILAGSRRPDAFVIARTSLELEEILGAPVDLVLLDAASPILRMEVLRAHRVLAKRDPEAFERFVVRTTLEYFDLKQVRAPIERALLGDIGP